MRVLLLKLTEYVTKLENGRNTLVGIFDDIRAAELPIEHPPFFVCAQIALEPRDFGKTHHLRFQLNAPDNSSVFDIEAPLTLPNTIDHPDPKIFISVNVAGARMSKEGIYKLQAILEGHPLFTDTMPVVVVQQPQA